ncbi:MAG TPA: hypothetical protein VK663_14715 [Burkholderiales bacterium]|nr:hypothetical protein [Burkholderiales bacterium]
MKIAIARLNYVVRGIDGHAAKIFAAVALTAFVCRILGINHSGGGPPTS